MNKAKTGGVSLTLSATTQAVLGCLAWTAQGASFQGDNSHTRLVSSIHPRDQCQGICAWVERGHIPSGQPCRILEPDTASQHDLTPVAGSLST